MNRIARRTVIVLLLALAAGVPPAAQETDAPTDAAPGELQREMQKFFADRLRAENPGAVVSRNADGTYRITRAR